MPPKKNQPEPDYEIIEFSGQQYSNSPLVKSKKKTFIFYSTYIYWLFFDIHTETTAALKCALCGSLTPKTRCEQCNNQILCTSCDEMYHRHPKRKMHVRKVSVIKFETVFIRLINIINWFNIDHWNGASAERKAAIATERRDLVADSATASQQKRSTGQSISWS